MSQFLVYYLKTIMKHIFYKVAHRPQAEIDSFSNRYEVFDTKLIPQIVKDTLGLSVLDIQKSHSWGTSHVVYFVKVKSSPTLRSEHQSVRSFGARNPAPDARLKGIHPTVLRPGHSGAGVKGQSKPLVLRANIGYGTPEYVMDTEKLITDKLLGMGIPTNKILYCDTSRKIYPFDFQIHEMLPGKDLENHFQGTRSVYDKLSFQLGQLIAKVHMVKLPGFGLFNQEQTRIGKLQGIHKKFSDYLRVCLDSDISYLVKATIISKIQANKIRLLFLESKSIIDTSQGVLVHHDLADHNLMFQNNTITGMFDWEAAVVGDPVLDLASCPTWKTHYPRENLLIAGYKSITKLPDHFEEKMNLYRLRTMLWKMVFAIRMKIVNENRKQKFYAAIEPFGF